MKKSLMLNVSPIDKIWNFFHQQKYKQHNLRIHSGNQRPVETARKEVILDPGVIMINENLHRSHSTNIMVGGIRPTTKSHLLKKLIRFSVWLASDLLASVSIGCSSSIDASKVSWSSSSRENAEFTNPGRNLYLSYQRKLEFQNTSHAN